MPKLVLKTAGFAETITHAAHLASSPLVAIEAIERLTSITLTLRADSTAMHTLERSPRRRDDAARIDGVAESVYAISLIAPDNNPDSDALNSRLLQRAERLIESTSLVTSAERFVLSSPSAHAFFASRRTSRTLIYLVSGVSGSFPGTAIRVDCPQHAAPTAQTIEIKHLTKDMVQTIEMKIDTARRLRLSEELRYSRRLVYDLIWTPIFDNWPDLRDGRITILPIGLVARLPIFSTISEQSSTYQHPDLTVAPSATGLHFASEQFVEHADGHPFVVADPWHGRRQIWETVTEARQVAALYGVEPYVVKRAQTQEDEVNLDVVKGLPTARTGSPSVIRQLESPEPRQHYQANLLPPLIAAIKNARIVHLACHGQIDIMGAAVLLHDVLGIEDLIGGSEIDVLPARPLITMSACEGGKAASTGIENEAWGFPAGLLAIGATNIIAPLWPVPDSPDTVEFMVMLHERLRWLPPSQALAAVMRDFETRGVSPFVWASYCCFGI